MTNTKINTLIISIAVILIMIIQLLNSSYYAFAQQPKTVKLDEYYIDKVLEKVEYLTDEQVNDIINKKIKDTDNSLQLENLNKEIEQEILKKEELAKQEELVRIENQKKTIETSRYVHASDINVYTELSVMRTVDVDQLNMIIDYWDSKCGGTIFKGQGQTFIDASKHSGLDPVYILAHAAIESAWGHSSIARDKHNYFGIGAFDNSPYSSSFHMGDGLYNGIVSGAIWIADNYYNRGQTSLYTMRYNNGSHEYCTSSTWTHNINSIIKTSYSLI